MKRYLPLSALLLSMLLFAAACKKTKIETATNLANANAAASATPDVAKMVEPMIEHDQQAVREHPDKPENYYNLANGYYTAGKYREAAEQYQQAIRLDKNREDAASRYELGQSYLRLNRYDDAVAAFKDSLKINPKNADAYRELGDAYAKKNLLKEAVGAYEKAVAVKPDLAEAHFSLGLAYSDLNQVEQSAKAFKEAARLNPKDADAFYNLGNSYSRLKQFNEAINAYQQAATLKPDNAEAHLRLVVLHLERGSRDAALAEYKTLKDLNPQMAAELNQKLNLGQ